MITHKDFESDCKRIAKYIMQQCGDSSCVTVKVSQALLVDFAKDVRYNKANTYVGEINKYLNGYRAKYKTHGIGGGWFIMFNIEFHDVDAETEDW